MRRVLAFFVPLVGLSLVNGFAKAAAPEDLVIPGMGPRAASATAAPAPTRARSGGGLGGGFIEFLVTGSAGSEPAPRRVAPVEPAPMAAPLVQTEVPLAPRAEPVAPRPKRQYAALTPPAQEALSGEPSDEYRRQEVAYAGSERPGVIIIDTPRKFLFLVQPGGRALRYGIGVGRPGFEWSGVKTISRKAEWPDWTPPPEMLLRRPDLPRHMAGGPENPLGARAMYLGSSMYRIHGTNEPSTIGQNLSSGCIRMMNEDVIDLYGRVPVGTKVIVM